MSPLPLHTHSGLHTFFLFFFVHSDTHSGIFLRFIFLASSSSSSSSFQSFLLSASSSVYKCLFCFHLLSLSVSVNNAQLGSQRTTAGYEFFKFLKIISSCHPFFSRSLCVHHFFSRAAFFLPIRSITFSCSSMWNSLSIRFVFKIFSSPPRLVLLVFNLCSLFCIR